MKRWIISLLLVAPAFALPVPLAQAKGLAQVQEHTGAFLQSLRTEKSLDLALYTAQGTLFWRSGTSLSGDLSSLQGDTLVITLDGQVYKLPVRFEGQGNALGEVQVEYDGHWISLQAFFALAGL
jgi:hypothetical protein